MFSTATRAGCQRAGQGGVSRGGRDEGAVELLQRVRPAGELAQPVQRAAVRVHGAPGMAPVIVIGTYERSSPGCEDADNVHEEAGPHHVRDLQSAFIVHNSIGGRGHGEHEGVADAGGAGHH